MGVCVPPDALPLAPTLPLHPPANLLPLPVQTGFMDLDTYLQFYGGKPIET